MLAIAGTTLALALAGCGGNDADGGGSGNEPEEAFGVEIDQRTPEAVAVSYVKLVDTCEPDAARRAFKLTLEPKGFEREAIDSTVSYDETRAQATEQFAAQGLCDDRNQAPVAEIVARVLHEAEDGTTLPQDTVLVSLDAGTSACEGTPTESLAVINVGGVWKVDGENTESLGGEGALLHTGCVDAP